MGSKTKENVKKSFEQRIVQEFQKPFFQKWDIDFIRILILTLVLEGVMIILLASQPVPVHSEKDITRIQERFANFILEESVRQDRDIIAADGSGAVVETEVEDLGDGGEGQGTGGGVGDGTGDGEGGGEGSALATRAEARMAASEARRRSREAISQEVSSKGILGLLTGTGSAAEGDAVAGFFSNGTGAGSGEDLDEVLASVDGLKTQGTAGGSGGTGGSGGRRGGRSGRKADIDDLVSDLAGTQSEALSRHGELRIEAPSDVEGRGRKSIYRSPEAIQEVLIAHNAAVRYCYERELKRTPTLKGKISVRITVDPNGYVKGAEIVTSTLNNTRVERCILARIRLWKDFQPIRAEEGDVTFRQTYTFGY